MRQVKEAKTPLKEEKGDLISGAIVPERFTSSTTYIKECSGHHSFNSSSVSDLNANKTISSFYYRNANYLLFVTKK